MKSSHWAACWLPAAALVSPVYAADYLSIPVAQQQLFPDAQAFVPRPLKFTDEQKDSIKAAAGVRQRWDEQQVWRAERAGKLLGWFIVDEVVGKHEFITYGTAISPDGKVIGVEILSYRETHGGQVREPAWRKTLQGKTLADRFKLDEDVPNISGATLSCRNVMDGVKRMLVIHKLFLANA